jgi:MFS family permease
MVKIKKYFVLFSTFLSGFIIMGFEIFGSRILRPHFGDGTKVWGALISVFLGGLAAGYQFGGKFADKNSGLKGLSVLMFSSGAIMLAFPLYGHFLCKLISLINADPGIQTIIAALCLFFIPSVLIGMMTPFFLKLNISGMESVGQGGGGIFALSTFGSIVGTLISSFILVLYIPSHFAVSLFGIILILNGIICLIIKKYSIPDTY